MDAKQIKVVVFGSYRTSDDYIRNRVVIDCMRSSSVSILEVQSETKPPAESNYDQVSSLFGILRYIFRQAKNFVSFLGQRKVLREADLIFIPYPAYIDFLFLVLLRRCDKPVLVDSFICLYDTIVFDRKMISESTLTARAIHLLEKRTLTSAQGVLIDTDVQRECLITRYHLPEEQVHVLPVGLDEQVWTSLPQQFMGDKFVVLFWGTFIPLHGIDTLIDAAILLDSTESDIEFRIIGDGQVAKEIAQKLNSIEVKNLHWRRGILETAELRKEIVRAHCVLGIFGQSAKAGNVIPYKVHQALASNRMLITRAGAAASADLSGERGIILVPPADSNALAHAILEARGRLIESPELHNREVYDHLYSNTVLRKKLCDVLDKFRVNS